MGSVCEERVIKEKCSPFRQNVFCNSKIILATYFQDDRLFIKQTWQSFSRKIQNNHSSTDFFNPNLLHDIGTFFWSAIQIKLKKKLIWLMWREYSLQRVDMSLIWYSLNRVISSIIDARNIRWEIKYLIQNIIFFYKLPPKL